jgi:Zn-dependent alcohol dehydrogenase
MKAAVCYEYGKPLVVEEVNLDPPRKGELKVRLAATAICHTDIHLIRGEFPMKLPVVAGHESAGYVEEVGEGVTRVKPGDAVVISLLSSCGKCYHCNIGLPHLCDDISGFTKKSPLHNKKGQELAQGLGVAGFAEYAVVNESQVVAISKEIPLASAALLGCGAITGFGAVVNRARVKPLSSVVVIGVGGVGINAVQGAAFSGAFPLIAVDVSDTKLQDAKKFGATHLVNAKKEDPVKAVQQLTNGRGAEYVFVAVGNVAAVQQGVAMSSKRGMIVAIGLPPAQQALDISLPGFIATEKTLTGAYMGSTKLTTDIPKLIAAYSAGVLKLDEQITGRYQLHQINEAIESVERGEAIRNVIVF